MTCLFEVRYVFVLCVSKFMTRFFGQFKWPQLTSPQMGPNGRLFVYWANPRDSTSMFRNQNAV